MRRALIALCALAALAGGCKKESGQVVLGLRIAGDAHKSPLRNPGTATRPASDVEKLSLLARNATTGEVQTSEFTNDFTVSNRIELGALPTKPGPGWTLTLRGVDRYGFSHAAGRSGTFEVPKEGQVEVPVVLGIADDFVISSDLGEGAGPGARANLLADGAVLVSGPGGFFVHDVRTGEVCGKDCLQGEQPAPRTQHVAVSLADGRVWLAHGRAADGALLADSFVFNGADRTFTKLTVANLTPRAGAAAIAMPDGQVVVVGGRGAALQDSRKVQFVNVDAASSSDGPVLSVGVFQPAIAPVGASGVLVTGGFDSQNKAVANAWFIGADRTVKDAPPMARARAGHSATTLLDDAVFLYGGLGQAGSPIAAPEVFILDASGGVFQDVQNSDPVEPAARAGHTAVRLPDGKVLVVGGEPPSFGVPDPAKQAPALLVTPTKVGVNYLFTTVEGGVSASRTLAAAATLPDGSVLFAGGARSALGNPEVVAGKVDWVKSAELFVPCADAVEACPR